MDTGVAIAAGTALGVAMVAAFFDSRSGEIPNWLTLPPILLVPPVYGFVWGILPGVRSFAAACLCALVPYLLFRAGGMGGGDVKVFGALGAITGFDLFEGVEIQLTSFGIAMTFALGALAWKGELIKTLYSAFAQALNPLRPSHRRHGPCRSMAVPIRLGVPIFIATALFTLPHLTFHWSSR